ncbi:hypothetical protein IQ269_11375 [Tychonema sp. LEGE 07199]|uniref:hypothetical protein n=1 Tax=unclassified Tychonema TaxID=2642144 RepID=UPI00187EBB55|nr:MULTISPECIES: hypothetical protein [unclassified Tychonema]MBE9121382.1 hypothetical protein [Tychonema sp. LEGE 07199]
MSIANSDYFFRLALSNRLRSRHSTEVKYATPPVTVTSSTKATKTRKLAIENSTTPPAWLRFEIMCDRT